MGFDYLFPHSPSAPLKKKKNHSRSPSPDFKNNTKDKNLSTSPTPISSTECRRFSVSPNYSPRVSGISPLRRHSLQPTEFDASIRGSERRGSMTAFTSSHKWKVNANNLMASRLSNAFISTYGPHSQTFSFSSKSEKYVKELIVELQTARTETRADVVPSEEWRQKYKFVSDIGTVVAVTIATFLSSVNREQGDVFSRRENTTGARNEPFSPSLISPPHFLKTLDLRQLRFTDSDFAKLLPALMQDVCIQHVFLCHNRLSDVGLKALVAQIEDRESFSNIVSLTLSYNGLITIQGVMDLLLHVSDLHQLSRLVLPASFPSSALSSVEVVSDSSTSPKATASTMHAASAPGKASSTLPSLSSPRSVQLEKCSNESFQHQSESQKGERYKEACSVGTPSFSLKLQKIGNVLVHNRKLCSIFFYGCRITSGDLSAHKVCDENKGNRSPFVFSQLSSASSEWKALLCCVLWWCHSLQEFGCLDMELGSERNESVKALDPTSLSTRTSTPTTPCVSASGSGPPSPGISDMPFSACSPTIIQRRRGNSEGRMNSVASNSFLCDSVSPYGSLNQRILKGERRDSSKVIKTSSEGQLKDGNNSFSSSSVLKVLRVVLCSPEHSLHTVILRTSLRSNEVALLASTIRSSSFLKKLVLRNCDLTAANYRELGTALTQNESITYLDLSYPHPTMKMETAESATLHSNSSGGWNLLDVHPTSSRHSVQASSEKLHSDPNGAKEPFFSRMFKKKRSNSVVSIPTSLVSPTTGASRTRPLRSLLSALDSKRRLKVLKLIEVAMDVEDIEDICDGIERRGNTSLVHLSTSFSRAEALLQKLRQLLLHNQMVADPECIYNGFKSFQEE